MSLLDKRMVVVTGKGGVGRTTCAAAIAVAAAKRGKRACVVELSGMGSVPPLFGLEGRSFAFRRATEGVYVWSLTVEECLDDFGRRKLKLPSLMRKLFQTRATRTFVDAIPGLHDLLQLGKLENLINEPLPDDPRFDLFVVDAPATGHGLTLLSSARSMSDVSKAGPFHDLAQIIGAFLEDRATTGVAVVTLPEDLPVSESLQLMAELRAMGLPPSAILANKRVPPPLEGLMPLSTVDEVVRPLPHGPQLLDLLVMAHRRAEAQTEALARLKAEVGAVPVVSLPSLNGVPVLPKALGPLLAEAL